MYISRGYYLVGCFLPAIATAKFTQEDLITRDVCILGGGATGTYAAVQLRQKGYSVALVEKKARLGGHSETLYLPDGRYVNYGVEGYFNNNITRDFFAQLNVEHKPLLPSTLIKHHIDFTTGEKVPPEKDGLGLIVAARLYRRSIEQFDYLSTGPFNLPNPMPEALLRPFREFVKQHKLDKALAIIFTFTHVVGNLLDTPLIYVIQSFGIPHIDALLGGGYIRPKNGTDVLFDKAVNYIDDLNIFYESIVSRARRDCDSVELVIETADGTEKYIRAKKLLITFPPTLSNLRGFDLRQEELALFTKWTYNSYYATAIANTGIPDNIDVVNTNPSNPGKLPLSPLQWELEYSGVPGYFMSKVVGDANFTAEDAKQMIISDIRRMGTAGTYDIKDPRIAAFASHSPEPLMVSVDNIRDGFYEKLYSLQGQQSTYYTGYTFCTDYSTPLWNYTRSVLDMMHLD